MIRAWWVVLDLPTTPLDEAGRPRRADRHKKLRFLMLTPVILSGGAGTRLWPLSRELYPKQLLALTGERTMLQQTALRLSGLSAGSSGVIFNDLSRFFLTRQLLT